MQSHYQKLLMKKLETEIERITASIGNGVPSDYAEYRECVGRIAGLRSALILADDVEKDMD